MTGREATCGHQVATRLTGGALFSCDRETGHDGDHAAAFTVCEWAGGDSRFPARVTWAVSTPAPYGVVMTCGCGEGTVWFDYKAKKWKGCPCGKVKGQSYRVDSV